MKIFRNTRSIVPDLEARTITATQICGEVYVMKVPEKMDFMDTYDKIKAKVYGLTKEEASGKAGTLATVNAIFKRKKELDSKTEYQRKR